MKKIMVVDDDDGILDAISVLLESSNFEVETSPDGEALLKLETKNLPDLILLDVLLSGKDGRELCKILKSQKSTKQIPIIMLSAHPSASETVADFGADDFIPKPFEMDELLNKIHKHLTKRKIKKHEN